MIDLLIVDSAYTCIYRCSTIMNWQTVTWQMCHKWPLSLLISWFLKRTIWLVSLINQELFTRPKHLGLSSVYWEEFEDTKMVIIIRKSKQDKQHNGQKKKDKRTSKAYTYNCKSNNKNPTLVSFLVYRTPCSLLIDPRPMKYRPSTYGISNPLSMVYRTPTHGILIPQPMYIEPQTMVFWFHYPWYFDPLPMVFWPLLMAYRPPYPWYVDPLPMVF